MLSSNMETKLNEHLNAEFYSSHLYLSMSAYFSSIELLGFAHWMKLQSEEEMIHAKGFYDFIDKLDGRVRLTTIQAPPVEWESPLEAFAHTYEHELDVSRRIHELVSLALSEKDHATNNFLQWFVAEQVEEESSVNTILKRLKFVGDSKVSLLMIDQELAKRVITPDAIP